MGRRGSGTVAGPDDIGRHLLDPRSPLLTANSPLVAPPKVRTEVTVDPKLFDGYVGRYRFAPAVFLTVTRDGNRLFVQLTGQPAFEVFAESEKDYFLKVACHGMPSRSRNQGILIAIGCAPFHSVRRPSSRRCSAPETIVRK